MQPHHSLQSLFLSGGRDTFLFPCQTGYAKNTCQPSGNAWLHTATQRGANYFTVVKIGWIKTQGGALIWGVFLNLLGEQGTY